MTKWLKVRSGRRGIFINYDRQCQYHFHRLTPQYRSIWRQQYALFFGVLCAEHRFPLGHSERGSLLATAASLKWSNTPTSIGENYYHRRLLGSSSALLFLLMSIPVPNFIHSALSYVGAMVTPLSLIYIGITLYDAGLKSIRLTKTPLPPSTANSPSLLRLWQALFYSATRGFPSPTLKLKR